MLYYRYRPGTPLSMKELIYDEMYFSSTSECNDPYEGKLFIEFDKNRNHWEQLIKLAMLDSNVHNSSVKISSSLIDRLVDCCVAMSPIGVNKFKALSYSDFHIKIYIDDIMPNNQLIDRPPLFEAIDRVKHYIRIHMPAEQYFVSFSKSRDNILMWSHYANNHRGYCLIFYPFDNKIMQDKRWMKRGFTFDTPNSFLSSKEITFIVDEGFELHRVEYVNEQSPQINAFMLFHNIINPEHFSKEVNEAMKIAYSSYLRKHPVWKYEEESRLLLFKGVPQNIANRTISLLSHQRLFHYDSSQLAGIILGAKMQPEQKAQIHEIVKQKIVMLNSESKEHIRPVDFVIFKARLSTDKINIDMDPLEIYTTKGVFNKAQGDFERLFDNWKKQTQWDFNDANKEVVI